MECRKGKMLILMNGYTYVCNQKARKTFYCTMRLRRRTQCKEAVLIMNKYGEIESANENHNHSPSTYVLADTGHYVKM